LLLSEDVEAQSALKGAIRKAPRAWEDHAATIGQFRMLGDQLGADVGWLEAYRPPASLHFQGAMSIAHDDATLRKEVDSWLEAENIGFGYGALAAGADIVIAEALHARGGQLHIVLPCPRENFRAQSVEPFGRDWAKRFDTLIAAAETVMANDTAQSPGDHAVSLSEAACVGMAIRNAENLQSAACILRIGIDLDRSKKRLMPWRERVDQTHILTSPQSGSGTPHQPIPDEQQHVFLAVRHADAIMDADFEGLSMRKDKDRYTIFAFSNLNDAWSAFKRLAADGSVAVPIALDQAFVGPEPEARQLDFRIGGLAETASDDQTLASSEIAFALLANFPNVRIEEAGEVRSNYGIFPAYAIISSN